MGFEVGYNKSLAYLKPDIAREWHTNKNGDLSPADFLCGSGKKYGGFVKKITNGQL